MRRLMRTNSARYEPNVLVKVSTMAMVGPTTSTVSASSAASTRLPIDSHFTPRSTPVTAEVMNSTVVTTMIAACVQRPMSVPKAACSPLLICVAPMPSEAATPKAVATTASTLKAGDSRCTKRHGSASVAELTSGSALRRKLKKAIDRPTMP
ncbi:hypothetical protein D9M72_232220 [compost metagenome]